MKKLFLFSFLWIISPISLLQAIDNSRRDQPPVVRYVGNRSGIESSTEIFTLDYDGNLLPGRNEFSDIGEATRTYKRLYVGSMDVSSGILNVRDRWFQPAPAVSTSIIVAVVSTAAFVSTGATFVSADYNLQPDYPRNVVVVTSFTFATSSSVVLGNCTFYGVNNLGISMVEVVPISTNPTTGKVAWASISSFTVSGTSVAATSFVSLRLEVGTTNSFGFSNIVISTADIYKLLEGSSNNVIDSNVVTETTSTYTIQFENAPNGVRNYETWAINRRSRR